MEGGSNGGAPMEGPFWDLLQRLHVWHDDEHLRVGGHTEGGSLGRGSLERGCPVGVSRGGVPWGVPWGGPVGAVRLGHQPIRLQIKFKSSQVKALGDQMASQGKSSQVRAIGDQMVSQVKSSQVKIIGRSDGKAHHWRQTQGSCHPWPMAPSTMRGCKGPAPWDPLHGTPSMGPLHRTRSMGAPPSDPLRESPSVGSPPWGPLHETHSVNAP